MTIFSNLQSTKGQLCTLSYDFNSSFEELVREGIDFLILSTENGFSPLGQARGLLSQEMGVPEKEIVRWADWNRVESEAVANICFKPQKRGGALKGAVLTACENSKCYATLTQDRDGRPYRDFYYNVTYEAIHFAAMECGATHIGISHLSRSGGYHEDIATCTAEALAHFQDVHQSSLMAFSFVGCCINKHHLMGIRRLNHERGSKHRRIKTDVEDFEFGNIVSLDWP